MEVALSILAQNPFSDEAVFAALAMVAKKADVKQFHTQSGEFFRAIGGATFFKRILATEGMELLGLNFLSLFVENPECVADVRRECTDELLQACELALVSKNVEGIKDACRMLTGMRNLSGTTRFLLRCLEPAIGDRETEIQSQATKAFALTDDPFFVIEDTQLAVRGLKKHLVAHFADLASGITRRWVQEPMTPVRSDVSSMYSRMQLATDAGLIARDILTSKNVDGRNRRAAIRLASVCVEWYRDILGTIPMFLPTLATVACIELRVGLARASSVITAQSTERSESDLKSSQQDTNWKVDELETMLAAAQALDRIATWMCASSESIANENTLVACINALTQTTHTSCQFFLETKGTGCKGDQDILQLKSILLCAVSSCLTLFWMDDPVVGSGLTEVARRSGFTKACGPMVCDADQSAVQFICPLLVHLNPELWIRSICADQFAALKSIVKEWNQAFESAAMVRTYFSGMVLIQAMTESPEAIEVIRQAIRFDSAIALLASTTKELSDLDQLEKCCVQCSCLALDSFLCWRQRNGTLDRAKVLLDEGDMLLKRHVDMDGPNDVGRSDFAELGARLGWHDLRKISEIVRLECT